MLTKMQYTILVDLDDEMYGGYAMFNQYDRKEVKKAIEELKAMGLVDFSRGLMTDDGEVAGSGWARKYGKHIEISLLLTEYETMGKDTS